MAVKLRLQRTGRRNHTQFRVVAADKRSPRDGQCIEVLGWCNPHGTSAISEDLNLERVDYWKSVGAEVSQTVNQIVRRVRNRKPGEAQSINAKVKTVAPKVVPASAEVSEEAATSES